MATRRINRRARDAYIAIRRRTRRGKCEWILFKFTSRKVPTFIRIRLLTVWPLSRVVWCDNQATVTAVSTSKLYDGLHVCPKHADDVSLSDQLQEMIESGGLE